MDVGLVCDSCSGFNKMGARSCSLCGDRLSLDAPRPRSLPTPLASPTVSDGSSSLSPSLSNGSSDSAGPGNAGSGSFARRPLASTFGDDYTRQGIPHASPRYVDCPTCGSDVIAGHRFCGHCGSRMDLPSKDSARPIQEHTASRTAAPPAERSRPDAVPARARAAGGSSPSAIPGRGSRSTQFFSAMQASRAKLVVIKGDGMDGVSFTLAGDEHLVGRTDTPILFEDDPFISPLHANFLYAAGKLIVQDEDSTNGVYLRTRGSTEVPFGTRFLVGEQVLEILAPPEFRGPEAMDDGTYFFASPPRPINFRIVQSLLGGNTGMVYHARQSRVTIGREDNDINFPDDPFISGSHAQVTVENDKLTLTDLDSKNGTFLRIQGHQVLEHGDYVFMGQQLLRVEIV